MRSRWLQIVLGVFVVLLALGYLFRNALATQVAALVLERTSPKLHCTRPEVSLSSSLTRVSFGEVECTMAEGPTRYAHVEGTSQIVLGIFEPSQLHIEKVTVDMRDRDVSHVQADTVAELASVTGLMEVLYKGMIDFSEMYSPDAPPVLIDELKMTRAGKQEALLHAFRKSADGEWDRCQASNVEATGVAKLVNLRELDMRIMPDRGQLQLGVYMSKPERNEEPDIAVDIRARALNDKRPSFSVQL
jgi:hypothetical protein